MRIMKTLYLVLLFAFGQAHAETSLFYAETVATPEETPVAVETIQFLGRGFQTRDRSDALVLACSDQDCKQLRFVHIKQNEAFFVGPTYTFSETASAQNGKKITKELLKKMDRRNYSSGVTYIALGCLAGLGIMVLAPASMVAGGALAGGTFVLMVVGAAHGKNQKNAFSKMDLMGTVSNKILNQSNNSNALLEKAQWNWSLNPKKVSRRFFNEALNVVENSK